MFTLTFQFADTNSRCGAWCENVKAAQNMHVPKKTQLEQDRVSAH